MVRSSHWGASRFVVCLQKRSECILLLPVECAVIEPEPGIHQPYRLKDVLFAKLLEIFVPGDPLVRGAHIGDPGEERGDHDDDDDHDEDREGGTQGEFSRERDGPGGIETVPGYDFPVS